MTSYDSRFDDAEAELNRGNPWRYREEGAPNPLTIEATGWSSGFTKHGEAEFLNGVDREGSPWSILVGSTVLKRRLIDGEVSEWDSDRTAFVVTNLEGRVQPGEIVSIRYLGDREGGNGKAYSDFKVARRPAEASAVGEPATADEDIPDTGDIPF